MQDHSSNSISNRNHNPDQNEQNQVKLALKTYRDVWIRGDAYKSSRCASNVVRLFKSIKERAPEIELRDFNVYFIEHVQDSQFPILKARAVIGRNEYIWWRYHVVLEYKGFILDLDNTNKPRAFQKKRYFKEFFPSTNDKVVFIIPGEDYLIWSPEIVSLRVFHRAIHFKFQPILMDQFVK